MRLRAWVHVADDNGAMRAFGPDDEVPAWAQARITNPHAWEPEDRAEQAQDAESAEAKPRRRRVKADGPVR